MALPIPSDTTNGTNGVETETGMPNLSTLPPADQNWQISLKGKVIAITGANRGIGLGIAEVCLANSAQAVYSLDLMEPSEDFFRLQKQHPHFKYKQMDVTNEESVKKAIDEIVQEEGTIHGMVVNAGMTKHQPVSAACLWFHVLGMPMLMVWQALDFTMEQVKQLFELNVFGAWSCATAAARKFISLGIKGLVDRGPSL